MWTNSVVKIGHPDTTVGKIVEIVMKAEAERSGDAAITVQKEAVRTDGVPPIRGRLDLCLEARLTTPGRHAKLEDLLELTRSRVADQGDGCQKVGRGHSVIVIEQA